MTPKASDLVLTGWADVTVCDCCGRKDLKATMLLRDSDGFVFHYGAACGAKALGRRYSSAAQMKRAADRAQAQKESFYRQHWTARAPVEAGNEQLKARRQAIADSELTQWLKEGASSDRLARWYALNPFQRQTLKGQA